MWQVLASAGLGAVTAALRNKEMKARDARTRAAAADALAASWARRDGVGSVPEIEKFEGTETGNLFQGAVGGGLQGAQFGGGGDAAAAAGLSLGAQEGIGQIGLFPLQLKQ